jgi:hypothetical protein
MLDAARIVSDARRSRRLAAVLARLLDRDAFRLTLCPDPPAAAA